MNGWILFFIFILFLLILPLFTQCGCKKKDVLESTVTVAPTVEIVTPIQQTPLPPSPFNTWNYKLHKNQDFYKCRGQQTYAPGTLPTFGLWTTKDRLNSPDCCFRKEFEWPYKIPCTAEDYAFPAECGRCQKSDCTGTNCRIRGVYEDSIYFL